MKDGKVKFGVVLFPGSNCDADALEAAVPDDSAPVARFAGMEPGRPVGGGAGRLHDEGREHRPQDRNEAVILAFLRHHREDFAARLRFRRRDRLLAHGDRL